MTPEEIRTIRAGLGLTQAALAAVMGYGAPARIAELESGRRAPSAAAERLLAAYRDGYRPADWPRPEAGK